MLIAFQYGLIAINISAFILCGYDKRCAINQKRRIPEMRLFLIAFFGGSAGLLLGMHVFRHKTKKISFQFIISLIAALHGLLLYCLNVYSR